MAFTDQSDLFASFHEDGFNRIIEHIRFQRPSLFNYATAEVAKNPQLTCTDIKAHPVLFDPKRNNPLFTIVDPLQIPGTNVAVNFVVQMSDLKIDFHPGKLFALPPELAPLAPQRLAIQLTVCGGIGCPGDDDLNQFIPPPKSPRPNDPTRANPDQPKPDPVVLPTRKLNCFCLSAFVTGGVRIVQYSGRPYLEPFLDGFEIVDIKPEGLENSLECLIKLMMKLVVLPGLRVLLERAPLNLTKGATDFFPAPTNITISAQPTSAALPNNPAIEDDQLKVFVKVEVA
jgi:hypothetical protein